MERAIGGGGSGGRTSAAVPPAPADRWCMMTPFLAPSPSLYLLHARVGGTSVINPIYIFRPHLRRRRLHHHPLCYYY